MPPPPIRLLLVASSSRVGDAGQTILNTVRYADPARLYPTVLTLMGRGPLARLAEQAGAEAHNWALENPRSPSLLRRMQLFLREGRFGLVHCFGRPAELLTRWVAHGQQIRLISSIPIGEPGRRWYHAAADRMTADGVTAWIGDSEAAGRVQIEREAAPPSRVFVVPPGIPERPLPDANAREKARLHLKIAEGEGPVLAVAAGVTRAEGHGDLIEAVSRVREKYPSLICLCAGKEDSGGPRRKTAESRGLGAAFRWLGSSHDRGALFDAADVAVVASHGDAMPHATIEALRAGLACVAIDHGAMAEIVRHEREGLLCPPGDPEALAAALQRALDDKPGMAEWGRAARRRFEEEFRVETMVERLTEVYERVVGRIPPPQSSDSGPA